MLADMENKDYLLLPCKYCGGHFLFDKAKRSDRIRE